MFSLNIGAKITIQHLSNNAHDLKAAKVATSQSQMSQFSVRQVTQDTSA